MSLSTSINDEATSLPFHIPVRRRLAEKMMTKTRFIEKNTSEMHFYQIDIEISIDIEYPIIPYIIISNTVFKTIQCLGAAL